MDMEDASGFEAACEQAWSWLGRVDIVVHNAGISQRSRVEEVTDEVLDRIMEVNFMGAVRLARLQLVRF